VAGSKGQNDWPDYTTGAYGSPVQIRTGVTGSKGQYVNRYTTGPFNFYILMFPTIYFLNINSYIIDCSEVMTVVDGKLLNKIYLKLIEKNYKIATAESCTGGLLAHTLTNISGSSDFFDRGIVSYSNESKTELLDVPKVVIDKYGAVSEEVAGLMAEGVKTKYKVDIGLSTTGIAGPSGATENKPVGLVYVGLSLKEKKIIKKFNFHGSRLQNKESTCDAALKLLYDEL
jgi:PncC family amidohydrolase